MIAARERFERANVIALDVVGTLVEPSEPIGATYAKVAADFGRPHDPAEVSERFAAAMRTIWGGTETATDEAGELERWRRTVALSLPECGDREDDIFAALWEHFAAASAWSWYEDARRFVERLARRGSLWGVASNFDRRLHLWRQTQPLLAPADFVWTSAELGVLKRNPDFYRRLRQRIEAIGGDGNWLMIGDQPANDIEPSLAAGWDAVRLDRAGQAGNVPQTETVGTTSAAIPTAAVTIASFDELP